MGRFAKKFGKKKTPSSGNMYDLYTLKIKAGHSSQDGVYESSNPLYRKYYPDMAEAIKQLSVKNSLQQEAQKDALKYVGNYLHTVQSESDFIKIIRATIETINDEMRNDPRAKPPEYYDFIIRAYQKAAHIIRDSL